MKKCIKCLETKPLTKEYFNISKVNKDGFRSECRICQKKYLKDYYNKNRKRLLKKNLEYQKKNKESVNNKKKKWAVRNKDKVKKAQKDYHKKNPHKKAEWEAKRRCCKIKATPKWSELDKISILYEKAQWLSSITGLTYHVDHIIPLQGENVCGLHVWSNLQIVQDIINFSKSNKHEN